MRDRVPHFRRGQRLRGEHLELIRQAALQFSAQPGTIYDGTGVYVRRMSPVARARVMGPFRAVLDGTLVYGSYTTGTISAPLQPEWDGETVTIYPDADWGTGDSRPSGATVIITWFPGDQRWCASLRCNQLPPP